MKSLVVKRSIVIAGHKTSVSLEDAFWQGLKEVAGAREVTLSDLVSAIDTGRDHGNLSSAIRLFVLGFYRDQAVVHEDRPANRAPEHNGRIRESTDHLIAAAD
jgi:predicted DNA-binding ribbon-helix-helix protein